MTPDELYLKLKEGFLGSNGPTRIFEDEIRIPVEGGTLVFHMFMEDDAGSWYFESDPTGAISQG